MKSPTSSRVLVTLAALGALLVSGEVHAADGSARLEPESISLGEAARLTVTSDQTGAGGALEPSIPEIDGVTIQKVGQQTRVTIVNGRAESSMAYVYSVVPERAGEVAISGIEVGSEPVDPVVLHVAAGAPGRAGAQHARAAGPSALPAAPRGQADDAASAARAFLRVRLDERALYAGESVPFKAQAYFRAGTGVTLTGAPTLSSDAFVVRGLDQEPKQTETTIRGEPYLVATWSGVLTAARPGKHPVEMTLPASLQYREQAQPVAGQGPTLRDLLGGGSPFDAFFQDPFFNSMLDRSAFGGFAEPGRVVSRDVVLRDGAGRIAVTPLPEKGRPDDFSGAVGQFELEASLAQRELTQGEPVDLSLAIRGAGNFGSFAAKGLASSESFKAYAPSSEFEPSGGAGTRGVLSLRQPVSALQAGELELPSARFSYFDPKVDRYVTKTSDPIAVRVAKAAPVEVAQSGEPDAQPATEPTREALSVRSLTTGGVPIWLWPAALALMLVGLAVASAATLRRTTHYRRVVERTRERLAARGQRSALDAAARRGDARAFVEAGHRAIQARLGSAWQVRPEHVTADELEARWPAAPGEMRALLELADAAHYGGKAPRLPEVGELRDWGRRLNRQLTTMEVPS